MKSFNFYVAPGLIITEEAILQAICFEYGISREMLFERIRNREITEPRFVAVALIIAVLNVRQVKLLESMSVYKNRSVYSYIRKTVKGLYEVNKDFRKKIDAIIDSIDADPAEKELWIQRMLTIETRRVYSSIRMQSPRKPNLYKK